MKSKIFLRLNKRRPDASRIDETQQLPTYLPSDVYEEFWASRLLLYTFQILVYLMKFNLTEHRTQGTLKA